MNNEVCFILHDSRHASKKSVSNAAFVCFFCLLLFVPEVNSNLPGEFCQTCCKCVNIWRTTKPATLINHHQPGIMFKVKYCICIMENQENVVCQCDDLMYSNHSDEMRLRDSDSTYCFLLMIGCVQMVLEMWGIANVLQLSCCNVLKFQVTSHFVSVLSVF